MMALKSLARLRAASLRLQLAWLISVLLLGALAIIGTVTTLTVSANLRTQTENSLYVAADAISSKIIAELENGVPLSDLWGGDQLLADSGSVQLLVHGTTVVFADAIDANFNVRQLTSQEISTLVVGSRYGPATTAISGLGDVTFVGSTFMTTASDNELTYVTGLAVADNQATVANLLVTLLLVGSLAGLAAVFIGYRLVRVALTPLEQVIGVADDVVAQPLTYGKVAPHVRVPLREGSSSSEAARVAKALNRLLGHVENALNVRNSSEESMRRFIGEASHELRNPLASIRGYADFYQNADNLPPDVEGALRRISDESERMSTLVERLLVLAKLDADATLNKESVDLSRAVLETVADARMRHPTHDWNIVLPVEPAIITGDDSAMRQILVNLLSNAGCHTPSGTRVTTTVTQAGRQTRIVVHDDGPGISPEALPSLFDRFTQVRASEGGLTRSREGLGLGLAIVQSLANAADQTISVTSSPGSTAFTVTAQSDATAELR